jgi:DNA ligase N terminus
MPSNANNSTVASEVVVDETMSQAAPAVVKPVKAVKSEDDAQEVVVVKTEAKKPAKKAASKKPAKAGGEAKPKASKPKAVKSESSAKKTDGGKKRKRSDSESESPDTPKVAAKRARPSGGSAKKAQQPLPEGRTPFAALAGILQTIESTAGKNKFTRALATFLAANKMRDDIEAVVYLCSGMISPDNKVRVGITSEFITKVFAKKFDAELETMRQRRKAAGDIGNLAAELFTEHAENSNDDMYKFEKSISCGSVYKMLQKIAGTTGKGSVSAKSSDVFSLFQRCTSAVEAKFMMRCLEGKLKIKLSAASVAKSLSLAFDGLKSDSTAEDLFTRTHDIAEILTILKEGGCAALAKRLSELRSTTRASDASEADSDDVKPVKKPAAKRASTVKQPEEEKMDVDEEDRVQDMPAAVDEDDESDTDEEQPAPKADTVASTETSEDDEEEDDEDVKVVETPAQKAIPVVDSEDEDDDDDDDE